MIHMSEIRGRNMQLITVKQCEDKGGKERTERSNNALLKCQMFFETNRNRFADFTTS